MALPVRRFFLWVEVLYIPDGMVLCEIILENAGANQAFFELFESALNTADGAFVNPLQA